MSDTTGRDTTKHSRTPALLGLPFDHQSSYMTGAGGGPAAIRKALRCDSSNMWTESGIDLGAEGALADLGDVEAGMDAGEEEAHRKIVESVGRLIDGGHIPLLLGGDHSVTYPAIAAVAERVGPVSILHFDAHPDLYDEFGGKRLSHACPFARIMEEGLASRLVQVGIRTANGHQIEQAERFGVETIMMSRIEQAAGLEFTGPLYISFDTDALDPAFAPGVSHPEPGGMPTRRAIEIIQSLKAPSYAGADIVELNPHLDLRGITAMACAKILKETAARLIAG
jgi:agmatinase